MLTGDGVSEVERGGLLDDAGAASVDEHQDGVPLRPQVDELLTRKSASALRGRPACGPRPSAGTGWGVCVGVATVFDTSQRFRGCVLRRKHGGRGDDDVSGRHRRWPPQPGEQGDVCAFEPSLLQQRAFLRGVLVAVQNRAQRLRTRRLREVNRAWRVFCGLQYERAQWPPPGRCRGRGRAGGQGQADRQPDSAALLGRL